MTDTNASHGFWDYLDRLVATSKIVIDRPAGSCHPRYPDVVYPLDHGYLDGTTTIDGGGVDLWVGTLPERVLDAIVLAVDLHKRDTEIKLLLGCAEIEKRVVFDFLNENSMRAMMVRR